MNKKFIQIPGANIPMSVKLAQVITFNLVFLGIIVFAAYAFKPLTKIFTIFIIIIAIRVTIQLINIFVYRNN